MGYNDSLMHSNPFRFQASREKPTPSSAEERRLTMEVIHHLREITLGRCFFGTGLPKFYLNFVSAN